VTLFRHATKMARYLFDRVFRSGKHSVWSAHSAEDVLILCLLFVHIISIAHLYHPISLLMIHVCMHCFLVGSIQRYSAEVSGIKSLVVSYWKRRHKDDGMGWASRIPVFQAPSPRTVESNGPLIQFYSGMCNTYYRPRSNQAHKPSFWRIGF
jgi:hypothetical protein